MIRLVMVEPLQTYSTERAQLDCSMIVNNIQILSINSQTVKFEIQCSHYYDIDLSKNIIYSNNKEQGKLSPYTIISNVMNFTDCLFNENWDQTSQRIDFITSQNMRVKDVITYCLEMGVSAKDPPSYFLTRLLADECLLYNMNADIQSQYPWIYQPFNDALVFLTNGR